MVFVIIFVITVKFAPTETPEPNEDNTVTLHYNNENAYEITEQIRGYSHYDESTDSYVVDKYVHVIVDDDTTSIGGYGFNGCASLISIEIPASVTSIGWNTFSSCSGLKQIHVDEGNQVYDSREDCNAIIKTETNELIEGRMGSKIPTSVMSIGYRAFSGRSSLTSIEIPASVTSIGTYVFDECDNLTSIKWNGNTYSDADAFMDAFWEKYPLPDDY